MKKSVRSTGKTQEVETKVGPELKQLFLPMLGALSNMRVTLLDFVFQIGLQGITALLEQERTRLVGPAEAHNPEGKYGRAGTAKSSLVLGGRKVKLDRPRVRTKVKKGSNEQSVEVPLETWEAFSKEDPLDERAAEQMVIGVSTRKYKRSLENLPENVESSGTSKSAVSRRFVEVTSAEFEKLMNQSIASLDIQALMLDGVAVAGHTIIVALGFDSGGNKHVLGLWEGATENAEVCKSLLADLVERGLPTNRTLLFVIDGSKALAKAVKDTFGKRQLIQRCQVHKRRNVEEHLPEEEKKSIGAAIQSAYSCGNAERAKARLIKIAQSIEKKYPGAAASLREGMDETLTVLRFGLSEALERTFATTNAIENLNGTVRHISRRVKNWQDGTMILRWFAIAMVEAQKGFRRLKGYKDMKTLVRVLRRHDAKLEKELAPKKEVAPAMEAA